MTHENGLQSENTAYNPQYFASFGHWPWIQTAYSRTFALYLQKMLIKTAFKSLFTDSFEFMIIQLSLCKPPPTLVVYI